MDYLAAGTKHSVVVEFDAEQLGQVEQLSP